MTWFDLLDVIETHGIVLSSSDKTLRTPEAATIRRIIKDWIASQGIRTAGLSYVMPLRVLSDLIACRHRDLIALPTGGVSWAVVVDAINDPRGGLGVVPRPYRAA